MQEKIRENVQAQGGFVYPSIFSHMTVFRWFMLKWSPCGPLKRVSEMIFRIRKNLKRSKRRLCICSCKRKTAHWKQSRKAILLRLDQFQTHTSAPLHGMTIVSKKIFGSIIFINKSHSEEQTEKCILKSLHVLTKRQNKKLSTGYVIYLYFLYSRRNAIVICAAVYRVGTSQIIAPTSTHTDIRQSTVSTFVNRFL